MEDRTQQDESTAVRRGELSGSVEELQAEMDRLRDVMAQEVNCCPGGGVMVRRGGPA